MVLGKLSLGSVELEYLSIREIFNAYQGYKERQEYQVRELWEAIRWQTFKIMNIQGKYLKIPLSNPQQLIQFAWEKKLPRHKKMNRKQQMKYQENMFYARNQ